MSAVLVIVTWLTTGPAVSLQDVPPAMECARLRTEVAQVIRAQAASNLTGMAGPLEIATVDDDLVVRTPIGREMVRLRCVAR